MPPQAQLDIRSAVRHSAQAVAKFTLITAAVASPQLVVELPLDAERIERDVWACVRNASGVETGMRCECELRFLLQSENVAVIPMAIGYNVTLATEFIAAPQCWNMQISSQPGPASGRQPNLIVTHRDASTYPIVVPAFFLKVRADRAQMWVNYANAAANYIVGAAILSMNP